MFFPDDCSVTSPGQRSVPTPWPTRWSVRSWSGSPSSRSALPPYHSYPDNSAPSSDRPPFSRTWTLLCPLAPAAPVDISPGSSTWMMTPYWTAAMVSELKHTFVACMCGKLILYRKLNLLIVYIYTKYRLKFCSNQPLFSFLILSISQSVHIY